MSTEEAYVKKHIENKVATIEFFHPAHNSLPGKILAQLADTITEVGQKDEVLVIILKSGGNRTFCAGASFTELISINDEQTGEKFFMGFANVINAMRKCPKFIIGRVQGKTVGGGVGLASAMDYCMATKYASIKLSEISIGIGPFVIGPAVERKIGVSAFSQVTINAQEFYAAEWAKEKGLYASVFETVEALDQAVEKLAGDLASYNPEALAESKTMFWSNTEPWEKLLEARAATSGKLVLSDFTRKKLQSYA